MSAMAVPYLACMLATAHFYALPPRVLPTIQAVEGGKPGIVHANTDGSADLGLMQINTIWLRPIAQVTRQTPAVVARRPDRRSLLLHRGGRSDPEVLPRRDTWPIAACHRDYHSHTPPLNLWYQAQVMERAAALFGPG